jgi:hypothetical protein
MEGLLIKIDVIKELKDKFVDATRMKRMVGQSPPDP